MLDGTLCYFLPTGSEGRLAAFGPLLIVGLLVSFDLIMGWLALLWIGWPPLRFWPILFGWPLRGHFPKNLIRPFYGLWPYCGLLHLGVIGLHYCSPVMTLPCPLSENILCLLWPAGPLYGLWPGILHDGPPRGPLLRDLHIVILSHFCSWLCHLPDGPPSTLHGSVLYFVDAIALHLGRWIDCLSGI